MTSPRLGQFSLWMIFATVMVACSSEPADEVPPVEDPPPPPAEASPAPPPQTPASIPLGPIGLVDPGLHQEPAKDDWQGEVFNDLAGAQLKKLGKLLQHPATLEASALEPFFAPGCGATLRLPARSRASVSYEPFLITTTQADHPQAQVPLESREFSHLIAPLREAEQLHSTIKLFTVDLDENRQPISSVYFQISGSTADETISIRSEWNCTWAWPSPDEPPLLTAVDVTDWQVTSAPRELFADCTGGIFAGADEASSQFSHGIDHWASRLERRYGIGLSGWHGLAIGDANGDGLDDVYICEPGGLPNRLLIHIADGSVVDASALSGTDFRLQTQSALFVDLDNDGDQDLALATTLGIILMANDGRGNFVVKSSRLVPEAAPLSVSAADYDLDGDLDLYFGCYSLRTSNIDGVQILGRPIPYHDANNGGRNVLLRNDRDWRFSEATVALGLDENNRRFTLAASWEDFDDDGDPDLYVANDYGRNNLYRNDRDAEGNCHFTDVAGQAGVEDISAGMSVCWSDADGDGDRDLYVSNMWSSAGNRIAYQRNFQSGASESQRAEFQRHARGNSLFLNNGDGTFADASVPAGVTMGRWAWGSRFADLNNDGRQDIAVANGFITQPDDSGDL